MSEADAAAETGERKVKLTVQDVYTQHPVTVTSDTSAPKASKLMAKHGIRRLPVVDGDKLVGIVTLSDLMRAAPSPATSLSVWEINYLVDKVKVKEVMTKDVYTVTPGTDLRDAASLMLERKIGGIPVVEGERVVGIVTESDAFRTLVRMLSDESA